MYIRSLTNAISPYGERTVKYLIKRNSFLLEKREFLI